MGRCVYTQFLNAAAGIEADLTVTRLTVDRFMVVTAAFTQTHVEAWIRNSIAEEDFCNVADLSDAYAMLNIQGPASRALLQSVSSDDLSASAFPFATCREIRIGYQTVLALRLTYVGELGWELYIATPFAQPVYDALIDAGRAHGLRHCGYHALNSLRIEKAYRDWPHDIGPSDTPLEAGLAFTCDWTKAGGFVGRDALLAQREAGAARRRLVQFLLEDPEPLLLSQRAHLPGRREGRFRDFRDVRAHTGCGRRSRVCRTRGWGERGIHQGGTLRDRNRHTQSRGPRIAYLPIRSQIDARAHLIEHTVIIAGGGAIGSACAYFLKSNADFASTILVVEPDPSYREAASTRSASSIRQQFSTPVNIQISAFGMEFLRDAPRRLGEPQSIWV